MKEILFVNACVREGSRTRLLADHLLSKLGGMILEVPLDRKTAEPLYTDTLQQRMRWTEEGSFDHPIFDNAKQLKQADIIVIAAPYWDLSIPAVLKAYLESLCNIGLTFDYSPEGVPTPLCKAQKLYFVTTSGAPIINDDFGYGYVKSLFSYFFGVKEFAYIKAEGLDIEGADVDAILEKAKKEIDALFGVRS